MLSSTDCESGTSAAPNAPCRIRNSTICTSDCAMPHSIEATVKPATEARKRRFSPKRAGEEPGRRRHDRGGGDVGGQHPGDLVLARRDAALDVRQRDVGDRRVERLHEGGEDHAGVIAGRLTPSGCARRSHHDLRRPGPPNSAARKCGRPRACPVSMSTSTLMPGAQRRPALVAGVDADAHRDALHDLDPVAAGVLRRQQLELLRRRRADALDGAVPFQVRIGVHRHRDRLPRPHIGQLGLLRHRLRPRRDPCRRGRTRSSRPQVCPGAMDGTCVTMPANGALTTVWSSSRCASSTCASACR